jgi:hypothetical protein
MRTALSLHIFWHMACRTIDLIVPVVFCDCSDRCTHKSIAPAVVTYAPIASAAQLATSHSSAMEAVVHGASSTMTPTLSEDVYATLHAASRLSYYTVGQIARAVSFDRASDWQLDLDLCTGHSIADDDGNTSREAPAA